MAGFWGGGGAGVLAGPGAGIAIPAGAYYGAAAGGVLGGLIGNTIASAILRKSGSDDEQSADKCDKFDPSKKVDQRDKEWHYHWDKESHKNRGGQPHWDRGNLHDGKQEWSPNGKDWYPK